MKKQQLIIALPILILVISAAVAFTNRTAKAPSSHTMTSPTPTTSPNPTVSAGAQTQAVNITIQDFDFSPKTVSVRVGTVVTWKNMDGMSHTVTGTDTATGPDSELLANGETYSFTFTKAGTYNYFCKPHPSMKGTILVTE